MIHGGNWRRTYRRSFTQWDEGESRGEFFSEGIAEYAAGLYVRRLDDPMSNLVSIGDETPSLALPDHYRQYNVVPEQDEGADAYALEVLAWGAEQAEMMPKDEFIRAALGAYSPDLVARLAAFRTVARVTNAMRPGLYRELRDLPHVPGNWQHGLEAVHEAVV